MARARRCIAEGNVLAVLAVFGERPRFQPLLIAQLHAAEIEHAILHRDGDALALAGGRALEQRCDNTKAKMQTRAAVADLRAGDERRALAEARGRGRAAGALCDILVDLAVLIGAGAEALDRRVNEARIDLLKALPGETHAIEHAGAEILDQHVAGLHQPFDQLLADRVLRVDGDRALVVIEHREIETVHARHVAELAARDIARARPLDLDDVGAEPSEKLRTCRSRLHMGEVENLNAVECLAHIPLQTSAVVPLIHSPRPLHSYSAARFPT